jgi:hypothetical protein
MLLVTQAVEYSKHRKLISRLKEVVWQAAVVYVTVEAEETGCLTLVLPMP